MLMAYAASSLLTPALTLPYSHYTILTRKKLAIVCCVEYDHRRYLCFCRTTDFRLIYYRNKQVGAHSLSNRRHNRNIYSGNILYSPFFTYADLLNRQCVHLTFGIIISAAGNLFIFKRERRETFRFAIGCVIWSVCTNSISFNVQLEIVSIFFYMNCGHWILAVVKQLVIAYSVVLQIFERCPRQGPSLFSCTSESRKSKLRM